MQEKTSNQTQKEKASFYEYDFLTYLSTYKLRSAITTLMEYRFCMYFADLFLMSREFEFTRIVGYISLVYVSHVNSILIRTSLYKYGVNSYDKRFLFWMRNISVRGTMPAIIFLCEYILNTMKGFDKLFVYTFSVLLRVIHFLCYIVTWIYVRDNKGDEKKIQGLEETYPKMKAPWLKKRYERLPYKPR